MNLVKYKCIHTILCWESLRLWTKKQNMRFINIHDLMMLRSLDCFCHTSWLMKMTSTSRQFNQKPMKAEFVVCHFSFWHSNFYYPNIGTPPVQRWWWTSYAKMTRSNISQNYEMILFKKSLMLNFLQLCDFNFWIWNQNGVRLI